MKSSKGSRICVIDYGMGNVQSVQNALTRLGADAVISSDPAELSHSEGLVLPGVGAFGVAMDNLKKRALVECLDEQVRVRKKPILGICLGMQLFADSSEELGSHKGLGWVSGTVKLIDSKGGTLQVPHVGWNSVSCVGDSPLFSLVKPETNFYFDHSYHFAVAPEYLVATTHYGNAVAAVVQKDNVVGMQFHPEKSQSAGLKLMRGFLNFVARGGGRA